MTRWASAFVAALAALSQRASAITQEEGVAALGKEGSDADESASAEAMW